MDRLKPNYRVAAGLAAGAICVVGVSLAPPATREKPESQPLTETDRHNLRVMECANALGILVVMRTDLPEECEPVRETIEFDESLDSYFLPAKTEYLRRNLVVPDTTRP